MKTNQNGFIAGIIIGLVIWGLVAFFIIKAIPQPKQPTYTTNDSIANVRIDSVRGEYQKVIDSIKKVKPKVVERVKYLREVDTLIYYGQDTACIEIIQRKNALIAGLDSLCNVLDEEARLYSDQNVLLNEKVRLEIKRNKTLSDSVSSLHVLYTDSLTAQRKTSDKAIKKEKGKTFFYKVTTTVATALGIYGIISK